MTTSIAILVVLTFSCALAWHDQPARKPEPKSPAKESGKAEQGEESINHLAHPVAVQQIAELRLIQPDASTI